MVENAEKLKIGKEDPVYTDYPKLADMASCANTYPENFCPQLKKIQFFDNGYTKFASMNQITKITCTAPNDFNIIIGN